MRVDPGETGPLEEVGSRVSPGEEHWLRRVGAEWDHCHLKWATREQERIEDPACEAGMHCLNLGFNIK